jgi:serine/threonine-protein kinase HipA
MPNPQEELALPVRGKKSGITGNDLFAYYAGERLQINDRILGEVVERFQGAARTWRELVDNSFLSTEMKVSYVKVLEERGGRVDL